MSPVPDLVFVLATIAAFAVLTFVVRAVERL
jgi:5-enolpyruvylshikimate-3-phosphate synthase